ncbi:hypothetical protein EG856_01595 [Mycoplasmopsis phocirhinis]|uniref:Uncharacterized protein n=1 Tax=Mycoplasmopsis phocirhinis TaxID=142650 RepID=A0A4P6MSF9_9BACT|nr:hypothetical protein [Mycoplasmopsis phocirhinis]QBF34614.1 hypothetical protein EG856_01595 [Mycoplasmopsis phocirhinis]
MKFKKINGLFFAGLATATIPLISISCSNESNYTKARRKLNEFIRKYSSNTLFQPEIRKLTNQFNALTQNDTTITDEQLHFFIGLINNLSYYFDNLGEFLKPKFPPRR